MISERLVGGGLDEHFAVEVYGFLLRLPREVPPLTDVEPLDDLRGRLLALSAGVVAGGEEPQRAKGGGEVASEIGKSVPLWIHKISFLKKGNALFVK